MRTSNGTRRSSETAVAQFEQALAVRGHLRRGRRAAALPRARDHALRPGQARRRHARRLRRLPRPALDRARADEGRHPLRPGGHARRVRRARDLDDLEVRAPAAAVRRREGRRPLQPARAVAAGARAPDAPLHVGAAAGDRAAGGHPRARHGDERADDGVDDGHVLDAGRPRRPGDRHRQADLDRRLRLPPRGDRRRRRDGDRACVRAARLEPRRAALRRPGLRQRRRHRRARAGRARRDRDRRLGRLRRRPRPGRARRAATARVRQRARLARGLSTGDADLERGAARAPLRRPRPRGARGPGDGGERAADPGAHDRRGRERPDLARGRRDPRRARHPGPARHPHERRRRHRLVLRVGAGPRPPLLGPRRDPRQLAEKMGDAFDRVWELSQEQRRHAAHRGARRRRSARWPRRSRRAASTRDGQAVRDAMVADPPRSTAVRPRRRRARRSTGRRCARSSSATRAASSASSPGRRSCARSSPRGATRARRRCARSPRSRRTRSTPSCRSTRRSASSRSTISSACRWSRRAGSSACSRGPSLQRRLAEDEPPAEDDAEDPCSVVL